MMGKMGLGLLGFVGKSLLSGGGAAGSGQKNAPDD